MCKIELAFSQLSVRNQDVYDCRVVTCLRQWVPKLKATGFSEVVFEDALDMLIDQLNSLGQADTLTLQTLESNMRDDTVRSDPHTAVRTVHSNWAAHVHNRDVSFTVFGAWPKVVWHIAVQSMSKGSMHFLWSGNRVWKCYGM